MPRTPVPVIDRIEAKIERIPESGCWIYMGFLNDAGYGMAGLGTRAQSTDRTHRITYRHYRGAIPDGLELDHLCRVRSCCNPWHLEPVTRKENCRRGDCGKTTGARQRSKTHCINGHPYDEQNTYWWHGKRSCKACAKARGAR